MPHSLYYGHLSPKDHLVCFLTLINMVRWDKQPEAWTFWSRISQIYGRNIPPFCNLAVHTSVGSDLRHCLRSCRGRAPLMGILRGPDFVLFVSKSLSIEEIIKLPCPSPCSCSTHGLLLPIQHPVGIYTKISQWKNYNLGIRKMPLFIICFLFLPYF